MAAELDTDPPLGAGTSRVLLESPALTGYGNAFDVSPDGQRFLFIHESLRDVGRRSLEVVLNWSEELKRLVPIED